MRDARALPVIIAAIICAAVFKLLLLDIVRVEGHSMEPTLRPGQVIYVSRLAFGLQLPLVGGYLVRWGAPRDGDVVLFRNPLDGVLVVKRCVGVQGDPVSVENRVLRVDATRLRLTAREAARFAGVRSVPTGTVFAAGDNPSISEDSRIYGFISVDRLQGKVMFIPPARPSHD